MVHLKWDLSPNYSTEDFSDSSCKIPVKHNPNTRFAKLRENYLYMKPKKE